MTRWAATVAAAALVLGGLVVATTGPAAADAYDPAPGAIFSNPAGTRAEKNAIMTHILRSIYSAPRGSKIKIASWNIRSHRAATALVRAARRGVSVQLVMERINAYAHEPDTSNPIPASAEANPDFFWMRREFRRANAGKAPGHLSWARLCVHSCRGHGGLAHTKMFLFSQVHRTKDVVMYGSFNLTDAATVAQWNDLYTSVGRPGLYDFAVLRFQEMSYDRAMAKPWRVNSFRGVRLGFFPWKGPDVVGDPVKRVFNRVVCSGATGGTGTNGHTRIRVAQTAIAGDRGIRLARALRHLWDRGCDVKLVYGLINPTALGIFRSRSGRGAMPVQQIAQDRNGDFVYDRYLHQKSMAISGHWGGRTNAQYAWNGSANWVGYTLVSDETFGRIDSPSLTRRYSRFVDRLYAHPPLSARGVLPPAMARVARIDPYAKFELD